VTQAYWLPYALPLQEPWQTSRGTTGLRRGRLLRLRSNDGRSGWGDCAPLPAFGIDETRATAFAEECAQLDLCAQRAGLPFDAWLGGNPPLASIAVNASLGSLQAVSCEKLTTTFTMGFRVIKLKIGVGTLAEEIELLRELACTLPTDCQLRLDANGAWSNAQARTFFSACHDLPIEACEEPLQSPTANDLARLQDAVPFAIAIDESLEQLGSVCFRHPPVRRIVIKPARQGSLLASMEIALRARAVGMEVIVSSALESSCGLLACAHLAAAVAPEAVHGLATASWFACDTGAAVSINNGRLIMPGETGIGFHWAGESAAAFAGES
jgi:O-succinylbenzoate synthase